MDKTLDGLKSVVLQGFHTETEVVEKLDTMLALFKKMRTVALARKMVYRKMDTLLNKGKLKEAASVYAEIPHQKVNL